MKFVPVIKYRSECGAANFYCSGRFDRQMFTGGAIKCDDHNEHVPCQTVDAVVTLVKVDLF